MTITSIGSSFSYIRPEAAARETSAAAISEESRAPTSSATAGSAPASAPQASGSAKPSVAEELRSLLVKTQESHASPPPPREAARAYGGR